MSTKCYALVRGSALRVTALDRRGAVTDPVRYGVSKAVAKIQISEVSDPATREILSTPDEEKRVRLDRSARTIRYTADIDFLRVDPGLYNLVAGTAVSLGPQPPAGFGEGGFGEMPFGEGSPGDPLGQERGFDVSTRTTPVAFGMEVWSKLAGQRCEDGSPLWGYTVFPYLRGGRITGFTIANGLVSFRLVGAQTRRLPRWGVGPHDIEGPFQRLTEQVSRNTNWRTLITSGAPPVQIDGTRTRLDVLDNGTAANPMPDPNAPLVVDGGGAVTSSYIIDGGRA